MSPTTRAHAPSVALTRSRASPLVGQLVRAKADANLKLAKSGDTPLITAAERGHLGCVQLLLGAGARCADRPVSTAEPSPGQL